MTKSVVTEKSMEPYTVFCCYFKKLYSVCSVIWRVTGEFWQIGMVRVEFWDDQSGSQGPALLGNLQAKVLCSPTAELSSFFTTAWLFLGRDEKESSKNCSPGSYGCLQWVHTRLACQRSIMNWGGSAGALSLSTELQATVLMDSWGDSLIVFNCVSTGVHRILMDSSKPMVKQMILIKLSGLKLRNNLPKSKTK